MKEFTNWELEKEIEKIIESNCEEYEYEGTEVNKGEMLYDFMQLIYKIAPEYKNTSFEDED